jgi:hypothetical protein
LAPRKAFNRKGREETRTAEEIVREIRTQRRRQWLLPPLARSSKDDRSNSLPETVSKISAVVPDVAAVGAQVAAVASQIAPVMTDVAALVACSPVISVAKIAP